MKIYFAIIIFLNISLIPWGYPADGNQDRKIQVSSKIAANAVSKDTLSQNTIHINGKENVVSINNTNVSGCDAKTVQNKKTTTNTIDINGEANSVKIHQNGQTGSVNINQNGNGNQVNVTQSKLQD